MTIGQRCASMAAVVFTTVALLAVTGIDKVPVGFSGEPYWQKTDPIFLLPKIPNTAFSRLVRVSYHHFLDWTS